MIDLRRGKRFALHDSSSLGAHRVDDGAIALSDTDVSAMLIYAPNGMHWCGMQYRCVRSR
jgi:hypothetical protein